MAILEEISSDMKDAMRAGEKEKVGALRLVLSELQKAAKEGFISLSLVLLYVTLTRLALN